LAPGCVCGSRWACSLEMIDCKRGSRDYDSLWEKLQDGNKGNRRVSYEDMRWRQICACVCVWSVTLPARAHPEGGIVSRKQTCARNTGRRDASHERCYAQYLRRTCKSTASRRSCLTPCKFTERRTGIGKGEVILTCGLSWCCVRKLRTSMYLHSYIQRSKNS
jgi:hypothetical protein